jgi:hypothetical protein
MNAEDLRKLADDMRDGRDDLPLPAIVLLACADVVEAAKHVDKYMDEEQWPNLSAALARLEAMKP